MKILLTLVAGFLFLSIDTRAQNKTLGVGTSTPNPNAALHVESPGSNQGFIMPRLTTAQRNAMASVPLTIADDGLMVYDKDLKKIFIWNGSTWLPTATAKYLISDPASADTALTAKTYSNQPHGFAISAIQKGTGDVAGYFLVDNPANNFAAIYGEQRGTGSSIMGGKWASNGNAGLFMNGNAGNNANALYVESNSNVANASSMASVMTGSGGNAGYFNLNNATSTYAGLYGATIGTGPAVMGETATGTAGVMGLTTGASNSAGIFQINNAANSNPVLNILSNGTGNAITANGKIQATQFIGDGSLLTGISGGGGGWSLTGNTSTVDGVSFIGTIDNIPLNFKVNNVNAGRIDANLFNTFLGSGAGNITMTGSQNNSIGGGLAANTTGSFNNVVGSPAFTANTTGSNNNAFGRSSVLNNTVGNFNVAMGDRSLMFNVAGSNATAIGTRAMQNSNDTASPFTNANVAVGFEALRGSTTASANTGNSNTAIGYQSMLNNTTGSSNSANGYFSLLSNTTGSNNTTHGLSSLYFNTSGSGNTSFGNFALFTNATGSNNTAIGYNADVVTGALSNATAIGYNSKVSANNSLVLGGTGADAVKVGIGVTAPAAFLDVAGNIKITDGTQGVGKVLTSNASGLASWVTPSGGSGWGLTGTNGTVDGTNFIGTIDNIPLNFRVNNDIAGRIDPNLANTFYGYQTGNTSTSGGSNTAIGWNALSAVTTGSSNTAMGYRALGSNTVNLGNTAVGNYALYNSTANHNTAVGNSTLFNTTTGGSNTASGYNALNANSTGSNNTSMGAASLFSNTTGSTNTALGNNALYTNTTGSNNIAIGNGADVTVNNLTNATAIGYNATVSSSNSLVLGGTGVDAVKVGIGTTTPLQQLDVVGTARATSFIGDGSGLTNVLPPGIIMPYAGASPPSGYSLCDGSAVSRTTNANLFAAIGTSWGVGDGSTTFNLPDLRGRFLRGVDGAAGNDPDAAARTATNGGNAGNSVGSYQLDDLKSHQHNSPSIVTYNGGNSGGATNLGNGFNVTPTSAGGNETRPKNAYVNYIIKQ